MPGESLVGSGTKTVSGKAGSQVKVDHQVLRQEDNHLHCVVFTAQCGNSVSIKKITIGSINGPRVEIDPKLMPQILQQEIDVHRQSVADDAEWKENTRLAIIQVQ